MVTSLFKRKVTAYDSKSLDGSSPPSVFVGRFGYPKVKIYPGTPPVFGETGSYEDPKTWLGVDLEEFLSMRLSILRGGTEINVRNASEPSGFLHDFQVMSLAEKPVDVEIKLDRNLSGKDILLSEHSPPMGPSGQMIGFSMGNVKVEKRVEYIYGDTDLLSIEGMMDLYERGIDVSRISRMLSTGTLGIGKNRRAVPTRWSITAVDKNVSDNILKEVKRNPWVNNYEVYVRKVNGNLFAALLSPGNWAYEWGEAWFPGTTWNLFADYANVMIDSEPYEGRKTYPDIGGCYYSTKLALLESLSSKGRQARAMVWREIYPGFDLPVGVWYVRENIRELFKSKPMLFDDYDKALCYMQTFFQVPGERWRGRSFVHKLNVMPTLDRYS
ncbi:MAG: Nre family DNA repair protein [Candidatus Thermoplasmatota archaeon]|nr:Nre family DNA repair protein [Candidatus Thermoplasmatota archaeon]